MLESFEEGRGIQRLLDYVFYQVAAINGYDNFGHYLRARLILNTCSRYYTRVVAGCAAKYAASAAQSSAVSATAAAGGRRQPDPRAHLRRARRQGPRHRRPRSHADRHGHTGEPSHGAAGVRAGRPDQARG